MDWTAFFSALAGILAGSPIVLLILGKLMDSILAKRLARYADELKQRAKMREEAAAIADLLAKWLEPRYGIAEDNNQWRHSMNHMYWKTILWLDKETLLKLCKTLANKPEAPNIRDIVAEARAIVLDLSESDVEGEELNLWAPQRREQS